MDFGFKQNMTLGSTLRRAGLVGFSSAAFLAFAVSAQADLVQNGGFESNQGPGQLNGSITSLLDWSNSGYNFLLTAATAASGVSSQYGTDDLGLWTSTGTCHGCGYSGPDVGNDPIGASPNGGYFVGADPSYLTGPLSQTINGLTVGDQYTLSFYYAGAQQVGYTGPTTEGWQVGLGNNLFATPVLSDASHSFTGWQRFSDTFTYSGGTNILSFLPVGGPDSSVPPFALLDGVSLSQTPEPGYLSVGFGIMALMLGAGIIKSRKRVKA